MATMTSGGAEVFSQIGHFHTPYRLARRAGYTALNIVESVRAGPTKTLSCSVSVQD